MPGKSTIKVVCVLYIGPWYKDCMCFLICLHIHMVSTVAVSICMSVIVCCLVPKVACTRSIAFHFHFLYVLISCLPSVWPRTACVILCKWDNSSAPALCYMCGPRVGLRHHYLFHSPHHIVSRDWLSCGLASCDCGVYVVGRCLYSFGSVSVCVQRVSSMNHSSIMYFTMALCSWPSVG